MSTAQLDLDALAAKHVAARPPLDQEQQRVAQLVESSGRRPLSNG